jgi:hypothetical protein
MRSANSPEAAPRSENRDEGVVGRTRTRAREEVARTPALLAAVRVRHRRPCSSATRKTPTAKSPPESRDDRDENGHAGTGSCSATTLTPALEALIRDQIDELFRAYREGDTLREIGGELGCAYSTVSRACARKGASSRPHQRRERCCGARRGERSGQSVERVAIRACKGGGAIVSECDVIRDYRARPIARPPGTG